MFRLHAEAGLLPPAAAVTVETIRPDGAREMFAIADRRGWLESTAPFPEPACSYRFMQKQFRSPCRPKGTGDAIV